MRTFHDLLGVVRSERARCQPVERLEPAPTTNKPKPKPNSKPAGAAPSADWFEVQDTLEEEEEEEVIEEEEGLEASAQAAEEEAEAGVEVAAEAEEDTATAVVGEVADPAPAAAAEVAEVAEVAALPIEEQVLANLQRMLAGWGVQDVAGYEGEGVQGAVAADPAPAATTATPTRAQVAAATPIARGDDVILVAPTGSGKTLAFLVPLVSNPQI